jgi:hypothetical protein
MKLYDLTVIDMGRTMYPRIKNVQPMKVISFIIQRSLKDGETRNDVKVNVCKSICLSALSKHECRLENPYILLKISTRSIQHTKFMQIEINFIILANKFLHETNRQIIN